MKVVSAWLDAHPRARVVALALYYLAIVAALVAMYGQGNHAAPEFVYEGF